MSRMGEIEERDGNAVAEGTPCFVIFRKYQSVCATKRDLARNRTSRQPDGSA